MYHLLLREMARANKTCYGYIMFLFGKNMFQHHFTGNCEANCFLKKSSEAFFSVYQPFQVNQMQMTLRKVEKSLLTKPLVLQSQLFGIMCSTFS